MDVIKNHMRQGVGMVVLNKEKKILAGKHIFINTKMISWFLKKPWQLPQGGLLEGETPYEAALRELREEIGTDNVKLIAETKGWLEYILPVNLRRNTEDPVIGQRQKWFLMLFLGNDSEINVKATSHSEFDTWRWMSVSNVIRLSVHFKHGLYVDVFREFKPHIINLNTSQYFA